MSDEPQDNPLPLRLVGRSLDGGQLELVDAGGSTYKIPIDDELRSSITAPKLAAVVSYDELPSFSVKDVQARLRAGESIDSISRTTDWPQEKIEKFAGPILQERAYVIDLALKSKLGREPKSSTLDEVMKTQLASHGVDLDEVEWNTYRLHDGTWNITLHYPNRDGAAQANWSFELANRTLTALDDSARWIVGEAKQARTRTPSHGLVYSSENNSSEHNSSERNSPAPRLVAVRDEIKVVINEVIEVDEGDYKEEDIFTEELDISIPDEPGADRDGVIKRPKLPSWDDIMFGGSKPQDD